MRIYLLILVILFPPAVVAGFPEVLDQVRPSIVGIGTYQATRRPPAKLMGTGFVIANGEYVVTNKHVMPERLDGEQREKLIVFIGRGDDARYAEASLVAQDEEHDLVLLKIDSKLPAMALAAAGSVREGEEYAFTGFPIGTVLGLYPVTHKGMVSAITPVATPVTSSRQLDVRMIRALQNPFVVYQLDATAYPGNSGSPLYDMQSGEVVAVINKVFVKETKELVLEKPSGITYAVPVVHLRALLERQGIAF